MGPWRGDFVPLRVARRLSCRLLERRVARVQRGRPAVRAVRERTVAAPCREIAEQRPGDEVVRLEPDRLEHVRLRLLVVAEPRIGSGLRVERLDGLTIERPG